MTDPKPISWTIETMEKKSFKLMIVSSHEVGRDATEADLLAAGYVKAGNDDEEAARWQQRIEETIRRHGLVPADCSGNDSGDPLDWTDNQVSAALYALEERLDTAADCAKSLRSELARVAAVVEAAKRWRREDLSHNERELAGLALDHAVDALFVPRWNGFSHAVDCGGYTPTGWSEELCNCGFDKET